MLAAFLQLLLQCLQALAQGALPLGEPHEEEIEDDPDGIVGGEEIGEIIHVRPLP